MGAEIGGRRVKRKVTVVLVGVMNGGKGRAEATGRRAGAAGRVGTGAGKKCRARGARAGRSRGR